SCGPMWTGTWCFGPRPMGRGLLQRQLGEQGVPLRGHPGPDHSGADVVIDSAGWARLRAKYNEESLKRAHLIFRLAAEVAGLAPADLGAQAIAGEHRAVWFNRVGPQLTGRSGRYPGVRGPQRSPGPTSSLRESVAWSTRRLRLYPSTRRGSAIIS